MNLFLPFVILLIQKFEMKKKISTILISNFKADISIMGLVFSTSNFFVTKIVQRRNRFLVWLKKLGFRIKLNKPFLVEYYNQSLMFLPRKGEKKMYERNRTVNNRYIIIDQKGKIKFLNLLVWYEFLFFSSFYTLPYEVRIWWLFSPNHITLQIFTVSYKAGYEWSL